MGRHIVFLGDNEGGMPIEIIDRPDAENSGNQFFFVKDPAGVTIQFM